jgi:repressor LexA
LKQARLEFRALTGDCLETFLAFLKERSQPLMLPRTQRQKEVLDYITRFMAGHGHGPSYAQIARHFGVSSKATIAKHITALEKRELVERVHKNGSFELILTREEVSSDNMCEVTVLGRIAAGAPIDAVEDVETISVPRFILGRVRPERVYALRVKGDSMIDEHICDGDIAIIENCNEARDGEIVVALIDGARATLKRLRKFGSEIELRAANPQHETLRYHASQVRIQGVFRALLRSSV